MSKRHVAEYKKTAAKVSKEPWNLDQAKDYLLTLAAKNDTEQDPNNLPAIDFVKGFKRDFSPMMPGEGREWHNSAPGTPKTVGVDMLRGPTRKRLVGKQKPEPAEKRPRGNAGRVGPGALASQLGCSKCRHSKKGCARCKKRAAKVPIVGQHILLILLALPHDPVHQSST